MKDMLNNNQKSNTPIAREILSCIESLPSSQNWVNEATFGLNQIQPFLDSLESGSNVLEVGSGSTILLNHLHSRYPDLKFTGIEPLGSGFSELSEFHQRLSEFGSCLFRGGYEQFKSEDKFDLIFLVNVFEHLPDWRDFLRFVKANLKNTGRCVILCPNYGFPYESHFNIPIIFNKFLTKFFFHSHIDSLESRRNCHGLWSSLNFVTWTKVKRECKYLNLDTVFRKDIIMELIDRLDRDVEFKKRQPLLGAMAKLLKRLKLLVLLELPLFFRIHPYMKIEIQLKNLL